MWDQLLDLLPKLRQALSCRVCLELLIDPYGSHSCEHYVCKGCLRKKRSLTPGCRWCSNLEKLTEEKQIKIVLACYQKLCEYIAQAPSGVPRLSTQNGEYNKTLAILQEAITSPISLADFSRVQIQQVPVDESASDSKVPSLNFKPNMALESRVMIPILPPEIRLLPKNKVTKLLTPSVTKEAVKAGRRKRKPFKGTYYNYSKKKKTALRLTKREANLPSIQEFAGSAFSDNGDPTESQPQKEIEEENGEIQVSNEVAPVEKQRKVVITPPGKKRKNKGKFKTCKCGTSSKVQTTRCVSSRCPCYSDGVSCELCPCLCCGNPCNNNNNNNANFKIMNGGCKLKVVDEKNIKTCKD